MCYEAITCPNCSSLNIVKNGKTWQRKQRFICKDCRRQFISDYTYLDCVGAVRALIVPLTMNGSCLRDISRVLLLSLNTVLKTLRRAAEEVSEPAVPRRVRDLEVDEFWSFVGAKERRRWWFMAISALGVGLTALAFYRSRVRRIVELERARTRIATDLHDDIGSSLSQIAILSEVSRQRLGEQQNRVGESLAQIANTSRDLVDSMSDIVWSINPRRDRVSDLTQRMREFAGDVFTAREIEFSFRASTGAPEVRLNADVRRRLYLIFKEAVNNAARHSRCTQAEIEFNVAQGRLLLRVRDNGGGFDPNGDAATGRSGAGLESMRERARSLGGQIEIISRANLGTTVKLNLPIGPRAGSRWRRYLPV